VYSSKAKGIFSTTVRTWTLKKPIISNM